MRKRPNVFSIQVELVDEKAGSVYTVSFLLRFFPIVPFHTTEKLPSNLYSATTQMTAKFFLQGAGLRPL